MLHPGRFASIPGQHLSSPAKQPPEGNLGRGEPGRFLSAALWLCGRFFVGPVCRCEVCLWPGIASGTTPFGVVWLRGQTRGNAALWGRIPLAFREGRQPIVWCGFRSVLLIHFPGSGPAPAHFWVSWPPNGPASRLHFWNCPTQLWPPWLPRITSSHSAAASVYS